MSDVCPCQTNWRTGEYHNSDCPEAKKLRDSWCSPECVTELLPEVDLDPATNVRSKVRARRHIVWTNDPSASHHLIPHINAGWHMGDGLKADWTGSIFLNGPYSDMLPWCQKANREWGAGNLTSAFFLVKLDPTTKWWSALIRGTGDVNEPCGPERHVDLWLPRKRLQHVPPPRIKASTNNFASAIIHWREFGTKSMRSLLKIADLWT